MGMAEVYHRPPVKPVAGRPLPHAYTATATRCLTSVGGGPKLLLAGPPLPAVGGRRGRISVPAADGRHGTAPTGRTAARESQGLRLTDRVHCIIGAGRLGPALAAALAAGGSRLLAIGLSPDSSADSLATPPRVPTGDAIRLALSADEPLVIWLAVPDDAIAGVAREVAAVLHAERLSETGQDVLVVHTSGLHPLGLLEPAVAAGARAACLHPLQSFAPGGDEATLRNVPVAVTAGDQETLKLGERLATALGGRPFPLQDDARPLYHLAAVIASNLLVALQAQAGDLLQAATGGTLEEAVERLRPLVTTTLANVHAHGPAHALTGPVARGDVGTIRAHLDLLEDRSPRYAEAYRALSLEAVALAAPRLDDEAVRALHELLAAPGRRE